MTFTDDTTFGGRNPAMRTRTGLTIEPIPGTNRARIAKDGSGQVISAKVKVGPYVPYKSKLEAAWAHRLGLDLRACLIAGWRYEPASFRLGNGKRYRPDFITWDSDKRVTFYEVKGHHKNIRAALVALAWFARETPWARVVLVTREKGQWVEREITP